MIPIDIVLQGPLQSYTARIADHYTKLPFVNAVVISCWETCPDIDDTMIDWENPKIYVLKSKDVEFPGSWNRNRLVKSSYEGIKATAADYVIKMRGDQIVSLESMAKLYDYYFNKHKVNPKYFGEEPKPLAKIGIMGMCKDYPYHPIDHIFWGRREDLLTLFGIEYDMSWYDEAALKRPYEELYTRSEVYLTTPYVGKYNKEAAKHLIDADTYLKDRASKASEALNTSQEVMEELFLLFPKIQLQWPKNGMQQYHYDVMETERGGHAYWATDADFS
jgi:hypothetical protein